MLRNKYRLHLKNPKTKQKPTNIKNYQITLTKYIYKYKAEKSQSPLRDNTARNLSKHFFQSMYVFLVRVDVYMPEYVCIKLGLFHYFIQKICQWMCFAFREKNEYGNIAVIECYNRDKQGDITVCETLPYLTGWKGLMKEEVIPDQNSNGLIGIVQVKVWREHRTFELRQWVVQSHKASIMLEEQQVAWYWLEGWVSRNDE